MTCTAPPRPALYPDVDSRLWEALRDARIACEANDHVGPPADATHLDVRCKCKCVVAKCAACVADIRKDLDRSCPWTCYYCGAKWGFGRLSLFVRLEPL